MNFAGFDIGGAHIKFATTHGHAQQISFPIWREKDRLREVLRRLKRDVGPQSRVGITMTAELADCFEDKKAGVEFVVNAIQDVFKDHQPLYYRTDGTMCCAQIAIQDWQLVAASNWHATGCLAFDEDSNFQSGYVFDIGSTTTDIIPVHLGRPVIEMQDDLARLSNGQLYYGGIGRTPVCSLVDQVETDKGLVSIAREFFATMRDVLIWRNELPAVESDFDSADGRSNSRLNAGRRLARMFCADLSSIDVSMVDLLALQARKQLVDGISESLVRVASVHPEVPLRFVTFGAGAWLAEEVVFQVFAGDQHEDQNQVKPTVYSFSENPVINQTAAALAVAKKRQQVFERSLQFNE